MTGVVILTPEKKPVPIAMIASTAKKRPKELFISRSVIFRRIFGFLFARFLFIISYTRFILHFGHRMTLIACPLQYLLQCSTSINTAFNH